MAALSPADLLLVEDVAAALKIGAGFDWQGAIKAFEGQDTRAKVMDGLIAADDVAKIVGVFVPPVAIVANDVGIAISAGEMIVTVVQWLRARPTKTPAGAPTLWGRIKAFLTPA